MDNAEQEILLALDAALRKPAPRNWIDAHLSVVEQKLNRDPAAVLAWEPVPLKLYGQGLPPMVRSSWIFILRAGTVTGAERHPNSHQRMTSYRGEGDFQVWRDGAWRSHLLVSELKAGLEQRWISIPVNVWHQAVVPAENWVVVSFHTAGVEDLIEERPGPNDPQSIRQRIYEPAKKAGGSGW